MGRTLSGWIQPERLLVLTDEINESFDWSGMAH